MNSIYHVDFETFSLADLKRFGAYRYASDPSTKILLCAISCGSGATLLWDSKATDAQNAPALKMIRAISDNPQNICYAHNAPFEIAISKYLWQKTFGCKPPALEQWRCTAALCRSAAIPSSLEQAAEFLKLDVKKDSVGKTLIRYFSVPQKKESPTVTINGVKTPRDTAWKMFGDYCKKDVEVEKLIHKRLAPLEFKGWLLDAFQMDLRMNDRGVRVNLEAVETAETIVAEYLEKVEARFLELTGLRTSQRDKVLQWLKERGYTGEDMTVGTVGETLSGDNALTPEAQEALQLRSYVSFAALKKLPTMREAACPDGRIKGMFKFWGAMRTGRYSSGIVQLQNMKRSTPESEAIYRVICDKAIDSTDIELLYGSPVEHIATGVRHFIDPGPGRQFIDVDFSQIEARVLPWLAGDQALLQAFREGKDLYKITYANTFGISYDKVTKPNRQMGKVIVLACQYGGGVSAMDTACAMYGVTLTRKEKKETVKKWRKANPEIVAMWGHMQDAAVKAIQNPGTWVRANDKCRFGVDNKLGYRVLVMELPSGRRLQYPFPEVKEVFKVRRRKAVEADAEDPDIDEMEWVDIPRHQATGPDGSLYDGVWQTHEISYYGQPPTGVNWGRIRTYGSRLCENETQSVSGDFLLLGTLNAERCGYEPVVTIHDQLLSDYNPERGDSVDGMVEALCKLPSWAKDFPLNAVGGLTEFYTKD